jgi:Mg2+/Co2+ transporter CorB
MTYDIWGSFLAIAFMLVMSAFFSGSETAMTATSRARISELEKRGSRRAAYVMALTKQPERLIGTLLLGNSVVNIAASALATVALVRLFGDSGAVIATGVMTVLVVIFAEVLPKTYAIANPDRVAVAISPILNILVKVLSPIVMGVEFIVRKFLSIFGITLRSDIRILSAHDEIRGAIELHHKEGTFVSKDKNMLGGILDLKDLEVLDVMVHRTKMVTLDSEMPVKELIDAVLASGHTRIPVWKELPENIVGILNAKSLFAALQKAGGNADAVKLDDALTDPWFVPDTRPLEGQLSAFLRRKTHFALVVDEYGEVQGLITLEDIIEEIVGDIRDEFDAVVKGARKQKDGSFVIDGAVPLRDLNRAMDWSLPDEEATTLAGLVIHEARTIPAQGEVFKKIEPLVTDSADSGG